jgi:hypothetical protein
LLLFLIELELVIDTGVQLTLLLFSLQEHILYSHPSGRTKVFLPNQQNPILCPVHIIDEEKEMRPAGASTPSCLFLCIKYGGRTRNLPQNQYVPWFLFYL